MHLVAEKSAPNLWGGRSLKRLCAGFSVSGRKDRTTMRSLRDLELSRRDVLIGAAASASVTVVPAVAKAQALVGSTGAAVAGAPSVAKVSFTVNGIARELELDTRTTLLDALRERLHLSGTKKGCDQGQCGA